MAKPASLTVNPLRVAIAAVAGLLALAGFGLAGRFWTAGSVLALTGAGITLGLLVDLEFGRWLRHPAGASGGPGGFLTARMVPLAGWGLTVLAPTLSVLAWQRTPGAPAWSADLLTLGGWTCGALLLVILTRVALRNDHAVDELVDQLGARPTRGAWGAALRFQRRWTTTLLPGRLFLVWKFCLGMAAWAIIGGGMLALGLYQHPPEEWRADLQPPQLAVLGAVVIWCGMRYLMLSGSLGWLLLVRHLRGGHSYSLQRVADFHNRALATTGLLATSGVALAEFSVIATFAFAGYEIHGLALGAGLPREAALACAILPAVAAHFVVATWAGGWTLAVMADHDCGWLRSFEVSTRLALSFGLAGLADALLSGLLRIGRLSTAVAWVRLERVDRARTLIDFVLGAKSLREVRAAAAEVDAASEAPLLVRRGNGALAEGRYLDAVNAFQMFLATEPEHLMALRGEARGLLALGSLHEARSRLERWGRLAPDDPEPGRLLGELDEGLWSEGGACALECARRATQHIGRGLTARDTS
jgi:hypothetical protein